MRFAPLPVCSVVLVSLALVGCSSTPEDKTAGWSPNRIHSEAKDEMNSGAYDKAVPLLEKLEGRAAGTRWRNRRSSIKPTHSTKAAKKPRPLPRSIAS